MNTTYKDQLVFGLTSLNNNNLITAVARIEVKLENPIFMTITPTPAEVRVVLANFTQLQQQYDSGNREQAPYLEQLRADLLKMMRVQFDGVSYVAQGDKEILSLSGFPVKKAPTRATTPPEAQIRKIASGALRGSIKVSLEPWRPRKFYQVEVIGASGKEMTYTGVKPSFLVTDFAPGEAVKISACYHNSAGIGPWSPKLEFVVPASDAVQRPDKTGNDKNMKVA
jgi:hypothetical protein